MKNLKKNIFFVTLSSVSSYIIIFLSIPIITRLYTPDEYGTAAIILNIIGIAGGFAALRYDRALILLKHKNQVPTMAGLGIFISLIISSILLFVISLYGKEISLLLSMDKSSMSLFFLIPAGVLVAGLYNVVSSWLQWERMFQAYSIALLVTAVASVLIKIITPLITSANSFVLVVGSITGSIAAFIIVAIKLNISPYTLYKKRKKWKELALEYKDFPLFNAPMAIVSNLNQRLPIFFLPFAFEPKIVGMYALAHTALYFPVSFISNSVNKVVLKEVSEENDNLQTQGNIIFKTTLFLIIIGLFPFALLHSYGEQIFSFIFGNSWAQAGSIAEIMTPYMFLIFIDPAIMSIFIVKRKQRVQLFLQLSLFLLKLIIIISQLNFTNDLYTIIRTYIYISVINHIIVLFLSIRFFRKLK